MSRGTKAHVAKRRQRVKAMLEAGNSVAQIREALGVTAQTVYVDRRELGMAGPKRQRRPKNETADEANARRTKRAVGELRDRRRFLLNAVASGQISVMAPEGAKRTLFLDKVLPPDGREDVLKDGKNNRKIGGDVLVGWLKSARIYTLTLEERATCPKSCKLWRGCYGNAMHHSRRWEAGPRLERRLGFEVARACAKHEKVLIRLHILGDFYSKQYALMWHDLLLQHRNLYIFGFTAHPKDSPIGGILSDMRELMPDRFHMRTSGMTGPWGSFTLPFPTQVNRIGDAVVCPEQLDANEGSPKEMHCGRCGVCWKTNVPVAFIEH